MFCTGDDKSYGRYGGVEKKMDMFAINKYKRKPVTDVSIKVYLNGRVFTEAGGHSAEAMGDKEIVQKVLSLALDSFFQPSSDMKKKYDFAVKYFSRLRDNEKKELRNDRRKDLL